MALKCGIIGITNVGKTTIFNCISATKGETTSFAFSATKSNKGIVKVPDPRLAMLEKYQPTNKVTPTTVELVDIPGLAIGFGKGEGSGNTFLDDIRNTDALIHVLRCFDDENLPHIDGSVNPVRDIENIDLELQARDLESVTKKIERLNKLAKTGDKDSVKAAEALALVQQHLENFNNVRSLEITPEIRKNIDDLFLLTAKPVLYVCNVDESGAREGNSYVKEVLDHLSGQNHEILVIAGAVEAEITELEDSSDRLEFLQDIGLEEPGVDKLVRSAYCLLDLLTFFTVGPKEIRAWTIRNGMTAPEAAGVIHTDLQRGYIRAEVMKYDDLIALGSEQACKDAGKFSIEGKNYIVKDGDILNIRFNI